MRNIFAALIMLFSLEAYSQVDTALVRRTTGSGQLPKIITDAHLRASSSLSIPFINSTTPSMNGAVNRAGYGLQLLSNSRLAIGVGASAFVQFMNTTELGTTYQTLSNLSTDLTASATKYPSVNAVNTGLGLKANSASPTLTGTPLTATPASNVNTTQIVNGVWVNTYFAPLASPALTGTPTVPTPAVGTNTNQASSTGFVQQEILADRVVNTTTTALTTSDLNTAYPSVKVGYRVICHLITGAPAIYTKVTEAGSSDVWLSTSATVTP